MKITIDYMPSEYELADSNWWCLHPDTQTGQELNAWGDSIVVTRCADCGAWYDEAFNTFDECAA